MFICFAWLAQISKPSSWTAYPRSKSNQFVTFEHLAHFLTLILVPLILGHLATHLLDVDGDVESMQDSVNGAGCEDQALRGSEKESKATRMCRNCEHTLKCPHSSWVLHS